MIQLPKKYISYSQMRLWLDDKVKYRNRYYKGLEEAGSKYMMFGSEIAKGLEDGTIVVPGLITYPVQEYQCKIDVDEVPFYAYVDQYWPEKFKFREIKTGVQKPDGSPRWTQNDVNNHMQLDIYSLLIQMKNGQVDEECHLDWIHTKPKMETIEFDGHVLQKEGKGMDLEGTVTSFARVITQEERDKMRALIRSIAEEISRDYSEYLSFKPEMSPALI